MERAHRGWLAAAQLLHPLQQPILCTIIYIHIFVSLYLSVTARLFYICIEFRAFGKLKGKKLKGSSGGGGDGQFCRISQDTKSTKCRRWWVLGETGESPRVSFSCKITASRAAKSNHTTHTANSSSTASKCFTLWTRSNCCAALCSLSKSNLLTTLQITCAFTQSKNIVSLRPPSSSFFSKTFIQESVFQTV